MLLDLISWILISVHAYSSGCWRMASVVRRTFLASVQSTESFATNRSSIAEDTTSTSTAKATKRSVCGGLSTRGLNVWGLNVWGLNVWGLKACGLKACGLKACGLKACGLNIRGFKACGLNTCGLNAFCLRACGLNIGWSYDMWPQCIWPRRKWPQRMWPQHMCHNTCTMIHMATTCVATAPLAQFWPQSDWP